jgi:GTPase SAR1 family protein
MSPPKPIVIIGSKGAGKSTFINHLFKYSSEDNLQNSVVVYLDLRDFFHSNDQFESKSICKFILNKIYDENENFGLHDLNVLKNIYIKEITQKDKGVWKYIKENDNKEYELKLSEFLTESQSDEVSHLEYVSKFLLTNRRKRLILIVDNADQYNDKIQEQVFLFSHSITKRLLCGSVISLREGYYYKWRFAPPFDAYQSNVYHITAPNYSEVLQKRINYALSNINLTQIDIEDKNSQGQRIKISNRSVVEFLSNLQYSLFESQNSEIVNFLNKTTYPNIREGLRIFSLFLTSGHTKVDEYILRERFRTEKDKHNMIPLHEFVKSVGLINKHYYSSRNSTIHNILIPAENSSDLFLNYYLLKHFSRTLEDKGYKQKYLSFLEVVSLFVDLGYRSNVIENSISNLLNYQLIDTENSLTDTMDILTNDNVNMAITLKGYYYVNELITHFHYLDLIVQDTPVYDDNYFQKIYKVFPMSDESGNRSLSDRAKTVRVFVDYLKFEEDKQSVRIQKMFKSFTDHIHSNLNKDLAVINTRVNVS